MKTLQDILNQRSLSALFQPIMNISDGTFLGFEGLIRGPANSTLHSPINLFAAAKQQGLSLEIEMLCRQIVLESFAAQSLPGKLFLNVSPDALTHPSFKNGQTLGYLENLGIDPKRVIIEITENQPTFDFEGMRNALLHYRNMGFKIAMDDLGEGFSSLRLWSELRPEFVKIDMHFVQGVNADPLKQQFIRSIQSIALSSGTQVIAEGIETAAEFRVIRDTGIACGQGYFIAPPHPPPAAEPARRSRLPDRQKLRRRTALWQQAQHRGGSIAALHRTRPAGHRGREDICLLFRKQGFARHSRRQVWPSRRPDQPL